MNPETLQEFIESNLNSRSYLSSEHIDINFEDFAQNNKSSRILNLQNIHFFKNSLDFELFFTFLEKHKHVKEIYDNKDLKYLDGYNLSILKPKLKALHVIATSKMKVEKFLDNNIKIKILSLETESFIPNAIFEKLNKCKNLRFLMLKDLSPDRECQIIYPKLLNFITSNNTLIGLKLYYQWFQETSFVNLFNALRLNKTLMYLEVIINIDFDDMSAKKIVSYLKDICKHLNITLHFKNFGRSSTFQKLLKNQINSTNDYLNQNYYLKTEKLSIPYLINSNSYLEYLNSSKTLNDYNSYIFSSLSLKKILLFFPPNLADCVDKKKYSFTFLDCDLQNLNIVQTIGMFAVESLSLFDCNLTSLTTDNVEQEPSSKQKD